jgi:hypothetical protein
VAGLADANTFTGAQVISLSSSAALEVGQNGATNPALRVVTNTASSATGLSITSAAAGSGVTLTALSSGSNEDLKFAAKGTGVIYTLSHLQLDSGKYIRGTDNYVRIWPTGSSSSGGINIGTSAYEDSIGSTGNFSIKANSTTSEAVYRFQGDLTTGFGRGGANKASMYSGGVKVGEFDNDATAGNTRFLLYDVDAGTLKRVSVGAADSGGSGYKVLRVTN